MDNFTIFKIVSALFLLTIIGIAIYELKENVPKDYDEKNGYFSGPVRPTDDEDYFRITGFTRPAQELVING